MTGMTIESISVQSRLEHIEMGARLPTSQKTPPTLLSTLPPAPLDLDNEVLDDRILIGQSPSAT